MSGTEVKNTYVAWGCGNYAHHMMDHLNRIKDNLPAKYKYLIPEIMFFIDHNPTKQTQLFFGKKINPPEILNTVNEVTIVISVKNTDDIKKEFSTLINEGGKRIITINEFLNEVKKEISQYRTEILKSDSVKDKGIRAWLIIDEKRTKTPDFHLSWSVVDEIIKAVGVAAFIAGLRYSYGEDISLILSDCKNWRFCKKKKYKKIGLVSSRLGIGGAERVVALLSTELVKKGYKVCLLNEVAEVDDYKFDQEAERVIIPNDFLGNTYEHLKELERVIKDYEIDVICFHIPYDGIEYFYKMIFFDLLGLGVVTECHTSAANLMRRWRGMPELDKIYQQNDYLVTLSKKDEMFWKGLGVRALFIPNPIDDSLRMPFRERHINSHRILWVGRISQKDKRVHDAVEIMRLLKEKGTDFSLSIIGTSVNKDEEVQLKELIYKYKLEENVNICGWKSDLSEVYSDGDILLMTSPGEGFPMVLLEAKAYSLPIVMYELPYLELAENNQGIIPIEQCNTQQAAEAIFRLMIDEKLYKKLNYQSWDSVQKYLHFDVGDAWDRLFQSMI